ncbi:MAG TPA: DUF4397 domain-containing protein [Chitinophagaceae bacterium]|nr:DUF4397 domain-containing protein [Chitinophagaceae bacterium]
MKSFFSFRKIVVATTGIAALGFLLSACSKFKVDDYNTPAAGLMSFNLAPDQGGVYITLSGNNLNNLPLAYTNFSGAYQAVYPGNRAIQTYNYPTDTAITEGNYLFTADKYYSLFVVGANGRYQNVVTNDNLDSLSNAAGKAFIRYINAIPDSSKPVVTIAANGNNVVNDNASFTAVSEFRSIDAGDVAVKVSNGSSIDASRNIPVEQGKVYTVLLAGVPGAADTTKAVQIKYILNGSLSDQ